MILDCVPMSTTEEIHGSANRPERRIKQILLHGFVLVLLLWIGGCSDVAYYWQAGMGQLQILNARRPISEVLEDPEVSEVVKTKLRLVMKAQAFGKEVLGMPDEHQFRYYSDIGRDYVSWLVVASEPYAVEGYQNCFPIVGCLGYRGFFDKADGDEFVAELAGQGYDVLIRPVRAYSTLGWFDDPILSSYIRSPDTQLIATIFHEQAHGVLFVKDDTAFSESFFTFVEREAVRRYLQTQGAEGSRQLERYRDFIGDQQRFRDIVLRGRRRLEQLYTSDIPREEMAAQKKRMFQMLREDYQKVKKSFKIASYDGWFHRELNNAHLVGFQQYRSWLKAFQGMFERNGRKLTQFFAAAAELAELPREERDARLRALENGVEEKRIADSRP